MPLATNYVTNRGVIPKSGRRISPSAVVHDSFTNPAILDADGISASHLGQDVAGTVNETIGGALASGGVAQLTPARNVVITVTHATSVVAMSGTITGKRFGKTLTEAWSVTAGSTSKVFTGTKAFDFVSSITETVVADASANTIISGTGIVLGLTSPVTIGGVGAAMKEVVDAAIVETGTLVAASTAAAADPLGTYLPSTAPDGAHDYDVWYISDLPERAAI